MAATTSDNFLRRLVDPENANLDIVAVHGLNPFNTAFHAEATWAAGDKLWLKHFLPKQLPQARILLFGYNSNVAFHTSTTGVQAHAENLLNRLWLIRNKAPARPILFIAHSLGGIVVKHALVEAKLDDEYGSIRTASYGIVFFGTPHQGGNYAKLGSVAAKICRALLLNDGNTLMESLETDRLFSEGLNRRFRHQLEDFRIISFYETRSFKKLGVIVDEKSATLGLPGTREKCIGLHADHVGICKFESDRGDDYEQVGGNIVKLAEAAVKNLEDQCRLATLSTSTKDPIPSSVHLASMLPHLSIDEFRVPFYLSGAPEIDYFVGRESTLASVEQILLPFTGLERKVVVLHGLGGIGKTQTAIRYAQQRRQDYTAILWFNAKDEDSLRQSFQKNAGRLPSGAIPLTLLDSSQNTFDLQRLVLAVKGWLAGSRNSQWLLIFDNLDNPKIPPNKDPSAYDIRPYFPEASHGSIILTTRWASLKIGKSVQVLKLDDRKHSLSILAEKSGRADVEDEPDVLELVDILDGLPLALATAGLYLSLESVSVTKYLQRYRQSWSNLQRTSPVLLSYEDQTLYSTWNVSYDHVHRHDKTATKMLQLWAYFDNQDLWFELLAARTDDAPIWLNHLVESDITFDAAMRKLWDHGLIYGLKDSGGYGMHHCVHAWTANVLNHEIEGFKVSFALNCVGSMVPKTPRAGDSALQRRLIPHANRCLQLLAVNSQSRASPIVTSVFNNASFNRLGMLYSDQGKLTEAELMYQRALKGQEKVSGLDHMSTLDIVNNLGTLYYSQNKLAETEAMYIRALKGYEKFWGPDHASTLETVNNLGILYSDQGKLAEAEKMYDRALKGFEKARDSDHTSTLDTVNNLGNLYCEQGKLAEAEEMYQRALRGKEKTLGPDHTSTLNTVNNLGILFGDQGKLAEAEEMYQRALKGQENAWGPNHTSTLDTVNNLGTLYYEQGKLAEAERMYQRALKGQEEAWGPNHTSTLETVNNLGTLYKDQGKLAEAEEMFQRALEGKEKALGSAHTSTLYIVNNLGTLYSDQGKLTEAEEMYQRALKGQEKALGLDHMSTLDTANNLGTLYYKQRKLVEAEVMYTRALKGYEKVWGSNHTSTLDTVNNLGDLYVKQGKLAEAERIYQRALKGYEKTLSPEHTSTLDTVNKMGTLYYDQGKLTEAEGKYQRALKGYKKTLGPEHTSTLNAVKNLGTVYYNQDKLVKAEEMYQQALKGYAEASGPDHPSTLELASDLGTVYSDQGKLVEAEEMYGRALRGYKKAEGLNHKSSLDTAYSLACLYQQQERYEESIALFRQAESGYRVVLGPQHPETVDALHCIERILKLQ